MMNPLLQSPEKTGLISFTLKTGVPSPLLAFATQIDRPFIHHIIPSDDVETITLVHGGIAVGHDQFQGRTQRGQ
jgi:hypothetical protein